MSTVKTTPARKNTKANNVPATLDVSILDPKNVPGALATINEKLASLAHITGSKFKTGNDFVVPGFENPISTERTVSQLIAMHSSVVNRKAAYDASTVALADELGSIAPSFDEILGANYDDVVADIRLATATATQQHKIDTLNSIKQELEQFLSAEDKKAMAMAKIAEKLTSL
jgi:hypothetical protein